MIIAQLSDLHLKADGALAYGQVDTEAFARRAVAAIGALDPAPDLVLLTGDLVHAGAVEEYELLADIVAPLDKPVRLVVGNHDARAPLRAVFSGAGYLPEDGFLHYVVEDHAVRVIVLDTLDEGAVGGLMCSERLAWLAARLDEAPQRPTVVAMHHPPAPLGISMDSVACAGGEAMAAILRRHDNVERVLCGHVHRAIHRRWAGTVLSTPPGPAHQIGLGLDPSGPFRVIMEPPSYQLHVWSGATGLVTHTCTVEAFPVVHEVRLG